RGFFYGPATCGVIRRQQLMQSCRNQSRTFLEEQPMQVPAEISFRNMDRSEYVEADVREQVAKLEEISDRITRCRVVVDVPHRHQHQGNLYHVRIRLGVPHRELVVDRAPAEKHAHEDVYVAVRDAFK